MPDLRVHELAFAAGYLTLRRAPGRSEPSVEGRSGHHPKHQTAARRLHQAHSVNPPPGARGYAVRVNRLPETAAALVRQQHC